MRREAERRVDTPLILIRQKFGEEQIAAVSCVEPAPEHAGDGIEEIGIRELRGAAGDEPFAKLRTDAALQVGHHSGDIDGKRVVGGRQA